MQIGRSAHLKCDVGHSAHMKDWLFNCGAHDYKPGKISTSLYVSAWRIKLMLTIS